MALVVTSSVQPEIDRILSAKNPFEVLKVDPLGPKATFSETVKKHFDEISALFMKRELMRDTRAIQARKSLTEAKVTLLDAQLLSVELGKLQTAAVASAEARDALRKLEKRTKELEQEATRLMQLKQTIEALQREETESTSATSST